ncbi:mannosyl-glycoprotein endo-beta-N-acetylglucosaminidase [Bacteroidales bacterium KA00344]|nr:mannosyl-glycoprotein endo-beta-N-acetylglucosaminidase [Bacteroidales bacterium KA00344]
MRWSSQYQTYFDQYKDLAIEQMLRHRIPASITLAQGVFESAAGRSLLATQGNNHFGIKCHGWSGRSMTYNDDAIGECFRVYDNPGESYEDHSKFLSQNQRYARLFSLSLTDYRGWAHGLKACGYATNPRYAYKLIEIIELYKLYLYDRAKEYDHFMAKHSGVAQPVRQNGQLHPIRIYNKNYYMMAREGDTFKAIGKETELSGRKIAKYNERNYHDVLHAGEIVYLKKKQKRASKAFKNKPHIVQPGESMYSIAQRYGIRLKSLYKKNKLSPDHQITVGEQLRVY